MLSQKEYEMLLPYRNDILRFEQTNSYKGDALVIIDKIRQARKWGAVCFSCEGSKVNAINDAVTLIKEYESAIGKQSL